MAEQIPSGQEPQPSAEDVVVFSPELLKLAKQRQEHLEECRQAADDGDCAAAVQMGRNYLYGTGGVQKDPEQAFYWFSQSAPDDPVGLYWQAVCYDSGTGVEADEHRAFALFQESSDMGYAPAICDLGVCYENGQGTEKDMDRAISLYEKAAASAIWGRCIMPAWAWSRTMKRRPTTSPWQPSSSCPGRSIFWVCATSSATAWRRT